MISVIVPAFNAEKSIAHCLESLLDQTMPRDAYEVIVVDDGSRDATYKIAQSFDVRVLSQSNGGAAAARNLGAKNARGDIVVFIDADSVPDKSWLEKMVAPFANPDIAGASGEKKTYQTNIWAQYVQIEYDYKYDLMRNHAYTDFIDSSTAAYRRDVFVQNGGFDTSFLEAEDTELSFRLAERGCKMVLIRDAIVYHIHPTSLWEYLRRKVQYSRWRAVVYRKFPNKVASETRTPWAQKLQIPLAFGMIPFVVGALVRNVLVWSVLFFALVFLISTLSFVRYAAMRNLAVAFIAPLTMWLAAYANGIGALLGFLQRGKS
jgi:cellulose synthase/poly-beta-1,6-N-acetylglucosamine synthase-like glycosyltransferase